jgi:hypothetical protein
VKEYVKTLYNLLNNNNKSGELHEKHAVSTSGCESDDSIGLNVEVNWCQD